MENAISKNDSEVSLKELLLRLRSWILYFRSKRLILLISFAIGGLLGAIYVFNQKPTYTGSLVFIFANETKSNSSLINLAGQLGVDLGNSANAGLFEATSMTELFKTKKILKGALFKKIPGTNNTLINYIGETQGLFSGWKANARTKDIVPFPDSAAKLNPIQDSLIDVLSTVIVNNYLMIKSPDKQSPFYSVSTTSVDEVISINLPKNIQYEASRLYIETKTKAAKDNLTMLQKEADSLRYLLGGTISASAYTVDQTFNLNPAFQERRSGIQKNQLETQVLGVAYGEVIKNLEIAKITLQKETPLFQIIEEPNFPLVKKMPNKLKWILAGGIFTFFVAAGILLLKRMYLSIIND